MQVNNSYFIYPLCNAYEHLRNARCGGKCLRSTEKLSSWL